MKSSRAPEGMGPDELRHFWQEAASSGFLAQAVDSGELSEVYKAAIKFAAYVRGGMSQAECRRASVELILEADSDPPQLVN